LDSVSRPGAFSVTALAPMGRASATDTGTVNRWPGHSHKRSWLCPVDVSWTSMARFTLYRTARFRGGDTNYVGPRVLRFPASTNQNRGGVTADWAVGGDDTSAGALGVAVGPDRDVCGVSFVGYHTPEDQQPTSKREHEDPVCNEWSRGG